MCKLCDYTLYSNAESQQLTIKLLNMCNQYLTNLSLLHRSSKFWVNCPNDIILYKLLFLPHAFLSLLPLQKVSLCLRFAQTQLCSKRNTNSPILESACWQWGRFRGKNKMGMNTSYTVYILAQDKSIVYLNPSWKNLTQTSGPMQF